jgi:EF hand
MTASRLTTRTAALAFAITALVASLGFARTAQAADTAGDKMPASYAAMMKMKPMDIMHMMDTEKSGFVTKDQFMKFHEAMFDKMDKNKDGKLSREEWLGKIHMAQ